MHNINLLQRRQGMGFHTVYLLMPILKGIARVMGGLLVGVLQNNDRVFIIKSLIPTLKSTLSSCISNFKPPNNHVNLIRRITLVEFSPFKNEVKKQPSAILHHLQKAAETTCKEK